jgi:uroporphyrin-III C-methyltransferase / precorrin-2 dehydrogenase / sirohydrochlorin ferrochelatase
MHSLPVLLRLRDRPVILLGNGETAEAKRRLLLRAGARPVGEDDPLARIAIVAIEDEGEAAAAVKRLRSRGILVNAADRPALCDFTLPAIIDRDPVVIAIGTGGASAGLAKALRIAIETILPSGLSTLAQALGNARDAIRRRWPDAGDRRHALDKALSPDGPLDPLSDADGAAVERWIAEPGDTSAAGTETISLRSADPDDLTLREARLLGRADRIVHGPEIPGAILDRARADAVRMTDDMPRDPGLMGLTLLLKWKD